MRAIRPPISKIVVLNFRHQHANQSAQIHKKAANVDIPDFRVSTRIAAFSTTLGDCIPMILGVLTMFFLFRLLPFSSKDDVQAGDDGFP